MRGVAVLVVEDNSRLAELAAATLAGDGADVVVADCAAKAIALVERHEFDVVLTDFAMPGGDGLAVARALRSRRQQAKCLLWSASLPEGVDREAEKLGALVVAKVVGDDLRSLVRAAIDDQRQGAELTRWPQPAPTASGT
jgi:two-component system response regulator PilR (NtrC family)